MFKKILVTGGAGFFGSNFVRWVLKNTENVHITVLDKLTYAGNIKNLAGLDENRLRFVEGDVCDEAQLKKLMPEIDAVVHCAAESHVDNSIVCPEPFMQTNIFGTYVLLEACKENNVRFHHVSTDEVFGQLKLTENNKFSENSTYSPSSPYSATKAASDMLVMAWAKTYCVNATISNCSNNYGPNQNAEKLIPKTITNVLQGKPPVIYGNGENVRDWIHVEDHASAVWKILNCGKTAERFVVSANCEKSNLDVVKAILRVMNKPSSKLNFVKDRQGHDARYAANAEKLREHLSWKPKHTNFMEGLAQTICWYEQNEWFWNTDDE